MADVFYENHSQITRDKPYIYHKDSLGCAPHWHENVEILLFHTAATVYSDQEFYEVAPGDIVVISSDSVHNIPITVGIYYDCLIADCQYCADNSIDLTEINFNVVVKDEVAAGLFRTVASEAETESQFTETAVRAALLNLLVYLGRNHSCGNRDSSSKGRVIKQAIKYINNRLGSHISVDEIAEHISMSKYHFCREFKKETGYTVVGYINLMRCLKAKKLLASGNYTVSEAAGECGFENLSYFSKTFKAVTGYLPTKQKNV